MFLSQPRRRPGHGTDEDSHLREPLLSDDDRTEDKDERHPITPEPHSPRGGRDDGDGAVTAWQHLIASWLLNWSGLLKNILTKSQSLTATIFSTLALIQKPRVAPLQEKLPPIPLTPIQEGRLQRLKQRIAVQYNGDSTEHQGTLDSLWTTVFPGRERIPEKEGEGWKEMGWQGNHPATDFRGGGFFTLENFIYFAQKYPHSFLSLMRKEEGHRAEWEYPFAAAGVNITVLLIDMLDLRGDQPCSLPGRTFMRLLQEDENAFEDLYCLFFMALDEEWIRSGASYMEFNVVLKATKETLRKSLEQPGVSRIEDLPQYSLLKG